MAAKVVLALASGLVLGIGFVTSTAALLVVGLILFATTIGLDLHVVRNAGRPR